MEVPLPRSKTKRIAHRARSTSGSRCNANGVGSSVRPVDTNSGSPKSSRSRASERLMLGWVVPRRRAAKVTLRVSSSAWSARTALKSTSSSRTRGGISNPHDSHPHVALSEAGWCSVEPADGDRSDASVVGSGGRTAWVSDAGGGGGGVVLLTYNSLTNSGSITATGGTKGTKAGTGADGVNGSDGTVVQVVNA